MPGDARVGAGLGRSAGQPRASWVKLAVRPFVRFCFPNLQLYVGRMAEGRNGYASL